MRSKSATVAGQRCGQLAQLFTLRFHGPRRAVFAAGRTDLHDPVAQVFTQRAGANDARLAKA
ncbi:hypothetical protein P0D84_42760 [Paraburkholderia sp. RL17-337-BIB-A]|jgi:hypothetical protein